MAGDSSLAIKAFGFDMGGMPSRVQFTVLAVGSLVCAVAFAYLQEKVFLVEGFHYGGFMTLITTLTYAACGFFEIFMTGDKMKATYKDYLILSIFTLGGMYFTNWSLTYLNYPMRVVFKSSKVIPVMIMGVVLQGKRYTRAEYGTVATLATAIVIFTLGDANESPKFSVIGIFLISIGVLLDAVTANYEEKRFFRTCKCSQAEVMAYSSIFGAIYLLFPLTWSGELWESLDHASTHPEVVYMTVSFSALGYCGVAFILLLIKHFGATNAEIVKSCRKVCSIVLSYWAIAKPFGKLHIIGGLLFVMSIVMTVKVKSDKAKRRAAVAQGSSLPMTSLTNK